MDVQKLDDTMKYFIENQEMAGGELLIRKKGDVIFDHLWGFSDIQKEKPIERNSIYRLMSMSKLITATAVMQLVERGILELDAPVSRYLPEFGKPRVVTDDKWKFNEIDPVQVFQLLPHFSWKDVQTVPATREPTIRDLLSHSSGLEQGVCGLLSMMKRPDDDADLEERVRKLARQPLDFVPGTETSYSPTAAYDLLGYLVQKFGGCKTFGEYLWKYIFLPLDMQDTTFHLSKEQKTRLVRLYERNNDGKLTDVTDTEKDLRGLLKEGSSGYEAGCGGLYGTVRDFDHFGQMIHSGGKWNQIRILKEETVEKMHKEAQKRHLEPFPGMTWGLGFCIRQNKDKGRFALSEGSYGWSGAFGTHFFIDPKEDLQCVFMTNRADAGGSGFSISRKIEELVSEIWG